MIMPHHRTLAGVLVLLLTVLTVGTGAGAAGGPVNNPGTFVTERLADPQSLDPAYAYDTASEEIIYPNVYETLIGYDGSVLSHYVPVLAAQVPSTAQSPDHAGRAHVHVSDPQRGALPRRVRDDPRGRALLDPAVHAAGPRRRARRGCSSPPSSARTARATPRGTSS